MDVTSVAFFERLPTSDICFMSSGGADTGSTGSPIQLEARMNVSSYGRWIIAVYNDGNI